MKFKVGDILVRKNKLTQSDCAPCEVTHVDKGVYTLKWDYEGKTLEYPYSSALIDHDYELKGNGVELMLELL